MNQKNSLLFLMLISFISSSNSKRFSLNELKYYQKNKTIEYSLNELKLTMNFEGIHESESGEPNSNFTVDYTANFYNQENDGTLLYSDSLTKIGEETKGKINWVVDIQKNDQKDQKVEIKAKASLNGNNTENFNYDTFVIKYTVDKTLEFWGIYCGYIGAIIITFGVMYVYFYAFIGKDSFMLDNNLKTGLNKDNSSKELYTQEETTD